MCCATRRNRAPPPSRRDPSSSSEKSASLGLAPFSFGIVATPYEAAADVTAEMPRMLGTGAKRGVMPNTVSAPPSTR